jgi:hypothetical protein
MRVSKIVLRTHGSLVILVGIALAIVVNIGRVKGIGPMSFLQNNPLVTVGLFQAYLLIGVLGIVLWIGSYQDAIKKWHIIGALAHVPPLMANIIYWDLFKDIGMTSNSIAGMVMHCFWILVELFAFFYNPSVNVSEG